MLKIKEVPIPQPLKPTPKNSTESRRKGLENISAVISANPYMTIKLPKKFKENVVPAIT